MIISKNGVFIGKGYANDGMFKLSLDNNKVITSIYIVESSNFLWHARLVYVNFRSLKFMAKHGIIEYKHDNYNKCEICIQAKMTKLPFPKVERST